MVIFLKIVAHVKQNDYICGINEIDMEELRLQILNKIKENGVKNLKEFGYPHVNPENITKDVVYSGFFKSMLIENLGDNSSVDEVINHLINEIEINEQGQG